ncbi:hematopoietic SH2 domain-containing protein homolog [Osmerus mordax]|uniref:hematopoietic SH2 domain-containing protein homolog n=1 Tax=Osmerus mordax TaxID=8014 RepID=UPI00350F0B60
MQETQEAAAAAIAWFTEFQRHSVIRNGIVPEWFHGVISRKDAEEMLQSKTPGYFLVRVSETRIGYTLSYRADDRCRHFIIEVMRDGRYSILGEDTQHQSLQDLVDFHRRAPIMPFNEVLTVACGQLCGGKTDYAELLFTKRAPMQPSQAPPPTNPPSHNNTAHLKPTEETPPALPVRPITMKEQAPSTIHSNKALPAVPTSAPPRLYPCLDPEMFTFTLQSSTLVEPPIRPIPLPRKILAVVPTVTTSIPADQPPKLPARGCLAQRDLSPSQASCPAPNRSPRTPVVISSERSLPPPSMQTSHNDSNHKQPGRIQEGKSAVINNIKRKFQKKRTSSQNHMYSEICVQGGTPGALDRVEQQASENEYQELTGQHCSAPPLNSTMALSSPVDGLPPEYLHPPPFAPGY